MNGKSLFISDLHLRDGDQPAAKLFIQLLDRILREGVTGLYLLGDVFDLWIADHRYFVEKFHPVLTKLSELKSKGVEIHYFEGNHDLDLRPYFENHLGFIVHEGPLLKDFNGVRVRIEHGDQMDPEDRDYLFLRWFLRTPPLRWLGRHLPGKIVRWIGETASRKSRNYTTGVRQAVGRAGVEDKLLKHASRAFQQDPFQILVAGHVHVMVDRSVENIRVINLGTWLDVPVVFELSPQSAKITPVVTYLENSIKI